MMLSAEKVDVLGEREREKEDKGTTNSVPKAVVNFDD